MTPAEISLAFAREVAGHPDAVLVGGMPFCAKLGICLPDYVNNLTAVDIVMQAAGLEWEKNHSSWLPAIGAKKIRVGTFSVRKIPKEKEPSGFWYAVDQEPDWAPYHALCLAAIRCVHAMKVAERKYNDRENPE